MMKWLLQLHGVSSFSISVSVYSELVSVFCEFQCQDNYMAICKSPHPIFLIFEWKPGMKLLYNHFIHTIKEYSGFSINYEMEINLKEEF